ncbi:Long chain acyl-CoA synthetase 2 [Sesamum angolense]|uniref:Long chain acyl-CoA synthetase 2 n=1 Tax=Sesamum angolense TaxID=2727404 RepID=A0AAE2BXQ5_9LAMI|nr:Long chain acyl-CoA synthetase 2 [Sesamum angolense]
MGDYVKRREGCQRRKPSQGRCTAAFMQGWASGHHPTNESVKKNPNNQMLGRREIKDGKAGAYTWLTYQQVYDATLKIGSAIRRRGVNPGDKCGIYGANCPEWIMAMEACIGQSITYVPLYDTLGNVIHVQFSQFIAELGFYLFIFTHLHTSRISFASNISIMKSIVSFGKVPDKQKETAEELGVACFSWEEFALLGDLDENLPEEEDRHLHDNVHQWHNGRTKGCHSNQRCFHGRSLVYGSTSSRDRQSAHIFDQIMETYCIYCGSSIGFWQGDIRFLIEDLIVLKPTIFCGVPRVYDRIYTGIMDKISASGALRKSLFQIAYNYKLRNLEKGLRQEEASPFFDKLVFDKIRQGFGGRVRLMLSGAAPLPKHIEEFLRVTCCCVLSQGYGLTESCSGCFTSIANVFPMMGTVGVPMTTIEARLESVPEMGYDALSSVPRGEICLRGSTLFSGYHKRPDLTAEVVVDGWFHTGDVGEWQPNGALKLIDRKKNIFKLSQGEYVAVESIESVYSRCPLITSIWVYGNSFESFLVAVVVPEKKALEEWAANNQEKGDFQSLCSNIKARKYILDELNGTAKTHNLRGFEMLRGVHLEPVPFGIDRDLVTPTFKLKRPQLLTYYKECIDQLYSEAKGTKA